MAEYRIVFTRSARRELEGLQTGVARRIISRVEALASGPRPHGCAKLQGAADLWRIRVGDYRVVYAIDNKARLVDIRVVRHRSDEPGPAEIRTKIWGRESGSGHRSYLPLGAAARRRGLTAGGWEDENPGAQR